MISVPNPYAPKFLTLRTHLSPQECVRRLQPLTLPWLSIMLVFPWAFSKLPVMGWVDPTGFALRKRTLSDCSSLQPEAKAQFVGAPDGTRMRVRLGPRRWIIISDWIFLAYLILFGEGLTLLCRYERLNPRCCGPYAFAWPFLLPVLLEVLGLWAWRVVRDETTFLVNFLKQTLEAEEVPEIPAPLG